MKPQDAPLVTGVSVLCAVIFILLSISGYQVEAIVRGVAGPVRATLLPGCGHAPHLERTAETVAALTRQTEATTDDAIKTLGSK